MSAMLYSEILVFNNAGYSSYQQVGQIWFINRYSGSTLHRVVMRQENHQLKEIRNSQFFSVKFGGFFWDRKILIVISSFFFPPVDGLTGLTQAFSSAAGDSQLRQVFRACGNLSMFRCWDFRSKYYVNYIQLCFMLDADVEYSSMIFMISLIDSYNKQML